MLPEAEEMECSEASSKRCEEYVLLCAWTSFIGLKRPAATIVAWRQKVLARAERRASLVKSTDRDPSDEDKLPTLRFGAPQTTILGVKMNQDHFVIPHSVSG
jgi:hypothetical protein